jgi:hypothetical protein
METKERFLMYAVMLSFYRDGVWSKPYTYKSSYPVNIDDKVVAPTGRWFSVGKVVACHKDYEFNDKIIYKHIHSVLESI